MKLGPFTKAYLLCALWSSCDSDGTPFDAMFSLDDFSPDAIDKAKAECESFITEQWETLTLAGDAEQNGHDFWLTRNRHGAGFWCRGYSDAVAKTLTEASHKAGDISIYIGDDDKLHFG